MKTVNSISGGKTSAYIAANYKADFNVFSLVRTNDRACIYPDKKVRQIVSDKLGLEFIGTLEMDPIIKTILELEQFIGQKIDWVTGPTFEEITKRGDKTYLPSVIRRFCTDELKLEPIKKWWLNNIGEVVEMRIGYRANETRRAKNMMDKTIDGALQDKFIIGKHKNGNNKWELKKWQAPKFPLIKDNIYKDKIINFWNEKPVEFATLNNCVGCFHRSPILLNKLFNSEHKNKMEFFSSLEKNAINVSHFKTGLTYEKIKKHKPQQELKFTDFSECDSGLCGI
jgi:hypothetical protein